MEAILKKEFVFASISLSSNIIYILGHIVIALWSTKLCLTSEVMTVKHCYRHIFYYVTTLDSFIYNVRQRDCLQRELTGSEVGSVLLHRGHTYLIMREH